jgi:hypothetical protein
LLATLVEVGSTRLPTFFAPPLPAAFIPDSAHPFTKEEKNT